MFSRSARHAVKKPCVSGALHIAAGTWPLTYAQSQLLIVIIPRIARRCWFRAYMAVPRKKCLSLNLLLRSPPEFCHRRQQFAEDGTCLKPAWKRRWTKSSSKCNANMLSRPRRSGFKPMLMRGTWRMTIQNDLPRVSQTGKSSRATKSNKQDNMWLANERLC